MKQLLAIVLLSGFMQSSKGQTFNEWFRQKKTQKKYLVEQIAALQFYAGYVQKGYSIARKGLKAIGDIKKGDLNLHSDYFNALQGVNPTIKNAAKVAGIFRLQLDILSLYKQTGKQQQESDQFTPGEVSYYRKVFLNLIDQSSDVLDELIRVTTAGNMDMKDDERMQQIDALYTDMQDKLAFAQSFSSEAQLLAVQRQTALKEIKTSRMLNDIR